MKKTPFASVLLITGISLATSACAFADKNNHAYKQHNRYTETVYVRANQESYDAYGRVIKARPIYQQVAMDVPSQSCHVATYAYREPSRSGDSFAGTVVGGLLGAALGHELGNGRGGATAVGGIIGASIGNNASKSAGTTRYRDEQVCNTRYRTEYEQRLIGYDVSYSYMGRIYQIRTDRHPGDRIPVSVDVRTRYRG